jgi:hypothetical protein
MFPSSSNLQNLPGVRYLLTTPVSPSQDLTLVAKKLAAEFQNSDSFYLPSMHNMFNGIIFFLLFSIFFNTFYFVDNSDKQKGNPVKLTLENMTDAEFLACEALIACSMGYAGRNFSLRRENTTSLHLVN